MKILGIETSCDETAASLVDISYSRVEILSNVIDSQINIHKKYGGIVPEVAARNHVFKIIPVIEKTVKKAKPDFIAVTSGPGLATSLLVGVEAALTLSYLWKKPIVNINHLEAHLLANWLPNTTQGRLSKIPLPAVGLIVSGGHTQLVLIKKIGRYKTIGRTLDDAAGEAFDKVAKMLELGYPGGPAITQLARNGNPKTYDFPRPMINSGNYDFSFSGLKTAVLYKIKGMNFQDKRHMGAEQKKKYFGKDTKKLADVCASFQQAVIEVLIAKTIAAAKRFQAKSVLLAGGVSANKFLRQNLAFEVEKQLTNVYYQAPPMFATTDNAVMIAIAGHFNKKLARPALKANFKIKPNWQL